MPVRISAVICTYNRSELLKGAIESLISQTLPEEKYEILVVDNNSTDNTKKVIDSFKNKKNLRYLFEKKIGLSFARNCGQSNAHGQYICYIDDDAKAEKHFLERILYSFDEITPKPVSVGGRILPFYLDKKPIWFKDEYEMRSKGDTARFLKTDGSEDLYFSGSNFSLLVEVIRDTGLFDVIYGMQGKKNGLGDEVEFFKRLHKKFGSNCYLYYDPKIIVFHCANKKNFSWRWHFKRNYVSGKTMIRMRGRMRFLEIMRLKAGALYNVGKIIIKVLFTFNSYKFKQQWIIEQIVPLGGRFAALFYWKY